MYCTSCGSPNMQRLAVVYMSGFRDYRGTVVGFGRGLFVGRNKGTSQNRLSQIASPPRPRSAAKLVGIWTTIGLIAAWLGLMIWAQNTRAQQGTQNQHVRRPVAPQPSVQLSPELSLILKGLGITAVAIYLLSLPLGLRSIHRFNRDVFVPAAQKWEASFMCQNCGAIVDVREQTQAASRTG